MRCSPSKGLFRPRLVQEQDAEMSGIAWDLAVDGTVPGAQLGLLKATSGASPTLPSMPRSCPYPCVLLYCPLRPSRRVAAADSLVGLLAAFDRHAATAGEVLARLRGDVSRLRWNDRVPWPIR
jgi:hypothetical protein